MGDVLVTRPSGARVSPILLLLTMSLVYPQQRSNKPHPGMKLFFYIQALPPSGLGGLPQIPFADHKMEGLVSRT